MGRANIRAKAKAKYKRRLDGNNVPNLCTILIYEEIYKNGKIIIFQMYGSPKLPLTFTI